MTYFSDKIKILFSVGKKLIKRIFIDNSQNIFYFFIIHFIYFQYSKNQNKLFKK